MIALIRTIRFAFQDIFRNFSLSVMTVLVLVLMLMSVNTLLLIRFLTNEATRSVRDQLDVSIFFTHDVSEDQIDEVRTYIDSFPEVVDTTYYSQDEVLTQFKEKYSDNPDIIASLNELDENPLGPTMIVKTRSPSDYENIIKALSVPEYEDIVVAKTFTDTEKAIGRIHVITSQVENFSLVSSLLFAAIAFIIIFNTIRIAIYTQRTEISIKKLVGATDWFIRSPYIIEAIIFSLVSCAIVFAIVSGVVRVIDPHITAIFGREQILTSYLASSTLVLVGGQVTAVLILTIVSSLFAMRKHLRA